VIPRADIVGWRQTVMWVADAQVEQDLIISRALVEIFQSSRLSRKLAFRGGTALHKLYFNPAQRYSEDIDLVQVEAGPIGEILDGLQAVLNGFLGEPRRKQTEDGATLTYRMESEGPPVMPIRLKIEINTREHFALQGLLGKNFSVKSRWFTGSCTLITYTLEELLATKLRALYQRRKGRDLFDIWLGITLGKADTGKIVSLFKHYMKSEGHTVTARDYESNMREKMRHAGFLSDLNPLLSAGAHYDIGEAFSLLGKEILSKL